MNIESMLKDLHIRSAFPTRAASALAICMLLIGPAIAQRSSEAGPTVNRQDASAETAAANIDDRRSESSSRENEAQPTMPDAPSASQHVNSSGGSLTFGERSRIYARSLLRPYSIVGPALGAGIGQAENEPPGWGQGAEGYSHRLASGMGRYLISESIRFGVAAADGEDTRYFRSAETGVWARARHAIAGTFTSQTSSGTRIPAYSRFAGVYGAAFISNAWYPDSRATPGWALRRGSTALASSLGLHLFEEFMPRKYFRALHLEGSPDEPLTAVPK